MAHLAFMITSMHLYSENLHYQLQQILKQKLVRTRYGKIEIAFRLGVAKKILMFSNLLSSQNLPSISVIHSRRKRAIPTVNSIVIGKILRISPRQAVMSIMAVGVVPTREQFQGIIRVQDVRQTEKDKVVMYKCYRPGDIVKYVFILSMLSDVNP